MEFNLKFESESNPKESSSKYLDDKEAIKEAEKKKCIVAFY